MKVNANRRVPKQKRSREKYEAILNACTLLLKTRGFNETTVLEISLESDVAIPTIYQYFASKEDIFEVWMERTLDTIIDSIDFSSIRKQEHDLEVVSQQLLMTGLTIMEGYRESVRNFLNEIPFGVVATIIEQAEIKIIAKVRVCLEEFDVKTDKVEFEQKLVTIARLFIGYLSQMVMRYKQDHDVEELHDRLFEIIKFHVFSENRQPPP